jgi:hypothetical protein
VVTGAFEAIYRLEAKELRRHNNMLALQHVSAKRLVQNFARWRRGVAVRKRVREQRQPHRSSWNREVEDRRLKAEKAEIYRSKAQKEARRRQAEEQVRKSEERERQRLHRKEIGLRKALRETELAGQEQEELQNEEEQRWRQALGRQRKKLKFQERAIKEAGLCRIHEKREISQKAERKWIRDAARKLARAEVRELQRERQAGVGPPFIGIYRPPLSTAQLGHRRH